ncbi:hypothetical protein [Octadecabacter ascidiaceicola]|nr:hypothetical protein [Octadecabacter ascidiaceicola]
MFKSYARAALLWFAATPVIAQEIQVRLSDVVVAVHSTHGTGIEMQFEIRGTRIRDVSDELLKELCDQFSSNVVPAVLQQRPQLDPDFIGVRVKSGGVVGSYIFEAFELDGESCGAVK